MIVRQHAWLAALLLALSLAGHALVPVGYMPSARNGTLGLMLCDGYAGLPTAHSGHHHHSSDDGQAGHHGAQPCAFATMAPFLPSADVTEIPVRANVRQEFIPSVGTPFRLSEPQPRPPSRGPPTLA